MRKAAFLLTLAVLSAWAMADHVLVDDNFEGASGPTDYATYSQVNPAGSSFSHQYAVRLLGDLRNAEDGSKFDAFHKSIGAEITPNDSFTVDVNFIRAHGGAGTPSAGFGVWYQVWGLWDGDNTSNDMNTAAGDGVGLFMAKHSNGNYYARMFLDGVDSPYLVTGVGTGSRCDVTMTYDPVTKTLTGSVDGGTPVTVTNASASFSLDTIGMNNGSMAIEDDSWHEPVAVYSTTLTSSVPEPATLALLAAGGVLMAARRRKR